MRRLRIIASDFLGLCRVCGVWIGLRWLLAIVTKFAACRRAGNLQPADGVIGDGPLVVRYGRGQAKLTCFRVLCGIRETWVRDVYLDRGFLTIGASDIVVDLGSNMGSFTTLALSQGPDVRVVAVEADPNECQKLKTNLALNGWTDRVKVVNAFVGGHTKFQNDLAATDRTGTIATISQSELLNLAGGRIDLLKCDIEGSEFDLFTADSPLLAASKQIAIELHPDAGDAQRVIDLCKSAGFKLNVKHYPPTIIALARRV